MGDIPYYHRRVKRWYLRRGPKRVPGQCLEVVVKSMAEELVEWVKT